MNEQKKRFLTFYEVVKLRKSVKSFANIYPSFQEKKGSLVHTILLPSKTNAYSFETVRQIASLFLAHPSQYLAGIEQVVERGSLWERACSTT
jgi:hypothetical protein